MDTQKNSLSRDVLRNGLDINENDTNHGFAKNGEKTADREDNTQSAQKAKSPHPVHSNSSNPSNLSNTSKKSNHTIRPSHPKSINGIKALLLSMILLGTLLLSASTIVTLADNQELDQKTGGLLSKSSRWIVCNVPAGNVFGDCEGDCELDVESSKNNRDTENVQNTQKGAKEGQELENEEYEEIEFIDQVQQWADYDSDTDETGSEKDTDQDDDEKNKQSQVAEAMEVDKSYVEQLRQEFFDKLQATGKDIYTISDLSFRPGTVDPTHMKDRTQIGAENATFYILVRNSELSQTLQTMREIEDRFNKEYRYPWTFLNDVPFTEEFKKLTTGMASGKTEYGLVPPEFWSLPSFINETKFDAALQDFEKRGVIYGGSTSYRHMCRFNSGFFYRHELMNQYKYYWRVEPGTRFFCDQRYDPFTFMRENNKTYGFVIAIAEYEDTIPTLWQTVDEFFTSNPQHVAPDNAQLFLTDKNHARPDDLDLQWRGKYNLCHFWSNFEIGDLDFFRGEAYSSFFEHLDQKGGFFYERWGDAPVHSIGVVMMLNKSQIHHFSDVGYKHPPYYRCPHDDESYTSGRCYCDSESVKDNVDFQPFSCLPKWWMHGGKHFLYKYKDELMLM